MLEIDQTALTRYQKCPYLYYKLSVEKIKEKEVSSALTFGSLIHSSLMKWYRNEPKEQIIKELEGYKSSLGELLRTKEKAQLILEDYWKRYDRGEFEVMDVEKEFKIQLTPELLFFGKVDAVVKWKGNIYVLEHKTSRTLGLSFFEGFRPNNQSYGYCWAVKQLYGECWGIIINGIQVVKSGQEFGRVIVSPMPEELDEWKKSLLDVAERIKQRTLSNQWRRDFGNCSNYFMRCSLYEGCVFGNWNEFNKEGDEK